jgi:putative membrane protein insertion efficiency factor
MSVRLQPSIAQAITLPALTARGLIRIYRYSLSSLMGRTCRHLPTCSEYTEEAIGSHGLWRGGWIGLSRIWRCRPGGSDGFDPSPAILPDRARWYLPWRYGRWRTGDHRHPGSESG